MALPVDPHLYLTFLGVMAVMAVTPGPANVFAVATGIQRGGGPALIGVLGMNLATLCWFAAAALGLAAVIAAFPHVFRVIAILGGLYVAWLGLKALARSSKGEAPQLDARVRRPRGAFLDGFMVQAANPKAVLFFTAVLPPFLDLNRPLAPQLALFACATIGMDVLAMSAYALFGAGLARRMNDPRFARVFNLAVGLLLLTAAALILLRR
ncbi:LysE family translocator [Brevundimonas sp. 2R-24]|uniref:LysE family translocator n=1 Tax=Peiella sedimenti TaxID=3061083 RepID=A0ABT8SJW6_9CAUL|nr:LysE family translocator [Caulobacteraceae bacterium XZ-24]